LQHLEVLVPVMIMVMPVIANLVGDTPEAVSAACSITVRCWGNNVMSAAPGTLCVRGFKHDKANRRDVSTVTFGFGKKLKCARSLELQRL
jgi:hypothetical protein